MSRPCTVFGLAVVASVAFATACSDPTSSTSGLQAVKTGNLAVVGSPTVSSAAPADAPRATTLDVQVNGSGFDDGSTATFPLNGVDDPRVHVNSTRYVSSTLLVANLTITADAPIVKYDVAVLATSGKKGIGTEMFTVTPAVPAIAYGISGAVWVMNSDGGRQTKLIVGVDPPHPSWSPDGKHIAYKPTSSGIATIDVSVGTDGNPHASSPTGLPITHSAFDHAWSPAGNQIAYSETPNVGSPGALYLVPATPTTPYVERRVYLAPGANKVRWLAWSPTATRITFIQRSVDGKADTLKILDLTASPQPTIVYTRGFKGGVMGVSWSRTLPDRLALAIPNASSIGCCSGPNQASILDITTNTLSNSPAGNSAVWSPDDSKLVFLRTNTSGIGTVAVVTLSTGVSTTLVSSGVEPDWRRTP